MLVLFGTSSATYGGAFAQSVPSRVETRQGSHCFCEIISYSKIRGPSIPRNVSSSSQRGDIKECEQPNPTPPTPLCPKVESDNPRGV